MPNLDETQPIRVRKNEKMNPTERRNLRLRVYSYISIALIVLLAHHEEVKLDLGWIKNVISSDASTEEVSDIPPVPYARPTLTPSLAPTSTPTQGLSPAEMGGTHQAIALATDIFIPTAAEPTPTLPHVETDPNLLEECNKFFQIFDGNERTGNYTLGVTPPDSWEVYPSFKNLMAAFGEANMLVGIDDRAAIILLDRVIHDLSVAISLEVNCHSQLVIARLRRAQALENSGDMQSAMREYELSWDAVAASTSGEQINFPSIITDQIFDGLCRTYEAQGYGLPGWCMQRSQN